MKDWSAMDRRDFLRMTAAASGAILAGSAAISSFPEDSQAAYASDWAPVSVPKLVLYNCPLFDGIQSRLQKGRIVVIEEGKIQAIEPRGDLGAFSSYATVDLGGRTLLPGLIDNHVHITVPFINHVNLSVITQMNRQIALNFRPTRTKFPVPG
jgi:imidazolonepropionase-like amidohydrolase